MWCASYKNTSLCVFVVVSMNMLQLLQQPHTPTNVVGNMLSKRFKKNKLKGDPNTQVLKKIFKKKTNWGIMQEVINVKKDVYAHRN